MKLYNPKHTLRRVMAIVALAIPLWGGPAICAQEADSTATAEKPHTSFFKRFSISTNALEWLLTVPNLGIEFDLSGGEYNNQSILVAAKYNWDTWHQHPAYYVFNLLDVKGEYRYHFRFQQAGKDEKFKLFSLNRKNPRTHLAYYIGTYGNYMQYSVKPGKSGLQGWGASLGGVIGFEKPLYEYDKSSIDLDLGLALGVGFSLFDRYRMSSSGDNYALQGNGWMIMPVLAEVRAAFTWRPVSVKDKYIERDPQIQVYKNKLADIKSNFEISTNKEAFFDFKVDSLISARNLVSPPDSAEKVAFRNDVYMKYIKDNSQIYRKDFYKFLETNKQELLAQIRDTVRVDTTKAGKVIVRTEFRTDLGLERSYMQKLQNAIESLTAKAKSDFDAKLSKDNHALINADMKKERERMKAEMEKEREEAKQNKEAEEKKKKEKRDSNMHAE